MVQKFLVSQISFYNLLSIKYTNGQKQETVRPNQRFNQ